MLMIVWRTAPDRCRWDAPGGGVHVGSWRHRSQGRAPLRLHLQPTHQPAGVGVEGVGDAEDVVKAEVALAAFDLADVRPVQGGALGQLLLRQAQLLAAVAHTPAELTSGW